MTCKRLVALALALCCLTSCASMLDREVTYTAAHVENPPARGDDAYRVNTYSGLCSALRSYIEEGLTQGELRFPATYPGNLSVDLEKAKRQLMEEDPLGCYALSDISFHTSRIIAYYEVTADFDYRVSPEEYMVMETVAYPHAGSDALTSRFRAAMEDFGGGFTIRLELAEPPVTETYDLLADSLRWAYDESPELALCYPELEAAYYPENAAHCVAVVKLTYPESATTLRLRQRGMLRAAETLADELDDPLLDDAESVYNTILAAYRLVKERFSYDAEGGAAAADALADGFANDEGLARLWQLLCHLKGVDRGVEGPPRGYEGYQAIITLPDGAATVLEFKPDTAKGGETP